MSGVLIALEGHLTKRSVLNAVFEYCRKMKFKVSVLLVDAGEPPSAALQEFLIRLKLAGLNGCLYRHAGNLGHAVLKHANRHKDIRLILVDSMKNWGPAPLRTLSQPVGLFSGIVAT